MNLKKINEDLKIALIENGLTEATELQLETFSPIKSGADVVIQGGKNTGKTTAMVINIIHKLKQPFQESPRALILVDDKSKVLEVLELFELYNKRNKLRVFGTHDKTDLDEDKNLISLGVDVLVGTPNKLNQMFSSAGFNVNTLQLTAFDDIDVLLKNRYESIILRLMESIQKGQRIFFCSQITERIELLADNIMKEPIFLEMEE
ncbi:RNA helicase [Flavobacterium sp. 316]|uniref:DEAD/DEAH box helicase n=1 Tax=Flavobacterium sediminilitoris TaxID=2024526 RepID=A0ABY4HQU2_9FLAO|nr:MULTISPECIES: DEAD/DEAH box helicase [Flavobacterium]KIX19911.1 RNA helicase [Flavobacterium sp. 316]UOX33879.1 DEAD/DEAH box helicase [Flavobacterium sediminilitoris]